MGNRKLNPDDFRVVSNNCMEISEDIYLFMVDRGNGLVLLFVSMAGSDTAVHVATEKIPDSSMEYVRSLFHDPYYMERLSSAISKACSP